MMEKQSQALRNIGSLEKLEKARKLCPRALSKGCSIDSAMYYLKAILWLQELLSSIKYWKQGIASTRLIGVLGSIFLSHKEILIFKIV